MSMNNNTTFTIAQADCIDIITRFGPSPASFIAWRVQCDEVAIVEALIELSDAGIVVMGDDAEREAALA